MNKHTTYPEVLSDELSIKRKFNTFNSKIVLFKTEQDFITFILNLENLFKEKFLYIDYIENTVGDLLKFQIETARSQFSTVDLSGHWYISINNGWDRHGSVESNMFVKLDTTNAVDGKELISQVIKYELERQDNGAFIDLAQIEDKRPSEVSGLLEKMKRHQYLVDKVSKLGLS